MSNNAGRILLGIALLGNAATLVSCTASGRADVRDSLIARSSIEQTVSKQLSQRFGDGKYSVACPHDLAAHERAAMACVVRFPDGEKFSGTVTVTSVDAGTAHWKYSPSSEPLKVK